MAIANRVYWAAQQKSPKKKFNDEENKKKWIVIQFSVWRQHSMFEINTKYPDFYFLPFFGLGFTRLSCCRCRMRCQPILCVFFCSSCSHFSRLPLSLFRFALFRIRFFLSFSKYKFMGKSSQSSNCFSIHNIRLYQGWVHCDSRTTRNNEWKVRKFCMPLVALLVLYFSSTFILSVSLSAVADILHRDVAAFFYFVVFFFSSILFSFSVDSGDIYIVCMQNGLVTSNVAQHLRKAFINNHKIYVTFFSIAFVCVNVFLLFVGNGFWSKPSNTATDNDNEIHIECWMEWIKSSITIVRIWMAPICFSIDTFAIEFVIFTAIERCLLTPISLTSSINTKFNSIAPFVANKCMRPTQAFAPYRNRHIWNAVYEINIFMHNIIKEVKQKYTTLVGIQSVSNWIVIKKMPQFHFTQWWVLWMNVSVLAFRSDSQYYFGIFSINKIAVFREKKS